MIGYESEIEKTAESGSKAPSQTEDAQHLPSAQQLRLNMTFMRAKKIVHIFLALFLLNIKVKEGFKNNFFLFYNKCYYL